MKIEHINKKTMNILLNRIRETKEYVLESKDFEHYKELVLESNFAYMLKTYDKSQSLEPAYYTTKMYPDYEGDKILSLPKLTKLSDYVKKIAVNNMFIYPHDVCKNVHSKFHELGYNTYLSNLHHRETDKMLHLAGSWHYWVAVKDFLKDVLYISSKGYSLEIGRKLGNRYLLIAEASNHLGSQWLGFVEIDMKVELIVSDKESADKFLQRDKTETFNRRK